nr:SDR family oxidoreductase [uncultured Desulfobacter sp.]
MIAITGASGQLGHLVIEQLLKKIDPSEVAALVRTPEKAADLQQRGVKLRTADYTKPETLAQALNGVKKLLLISSSEVGQRAPQHANVINAAKDAGVELLAYTSILHADTSPLPLRLEHLETEKAIRESGLPAVILRNGWYTENYAAGIPSALEHGALFGAADKGKISSAARADYAAAAAAVLLSDDQAGQVYELAGDESYTLKDFAQELSRQSGKTIEYKNLTQEAYFSLLKDAGLPEPIAAMLSESDNGAAQDGLFDNSGQLSRLIGRPTTPLADIIKAHLI